jgi:hypothetical protein
MNAKDSKYAICRHLKTDGRRCQSPALTGGALCYFHTNLHHAHRRPRTVEALSSGWQESAIEAEGDPEGDPLALARVYPHQDEIQFPPLEDAESIQLATSMLFQSIATGQIYFKRARLLLYTLKIACINQRALAVARAADTGTTAIPSRIVRTADGHALVPPDDDAAASADPPAAIGLSPTVASPALAHSSNLTPHSADPKTAKPEPTAEASPAPTAKPAPTARNIGAQGNALGSGASEDRSAESPLSTAHFDPQTHLTQIQSRI